MTVKELKEYLKGLPESTPVLIPARDHSYRLGDFETRFVLKTHNDEYTELVEADAIDSKVIIGLIFF